MRSRWKVGRHMASSICCRMMPSRRCFFRILESTSPRVLWPSTAECGVVVLECVWTVARLEAFAGEMLRMHYAHSM